MSEEIADILWDVVRSGPYWLALLAGLVVCLVKLGRSTGPSLTALAGFTLLLIGYLLSLILNNVLYLHYRDSMLTEEGHEAYMSWLRAVRVVAAVLEGTGVMLVLLAVFFGRRTLSTAAGGQRADSAPDATEHAAGTI